MGDIKKSIRKAFRPKSLKEAAIKWDSETQPNLYELDNFLRKSGYRLVDTLIHKGNIIEPVIEAIKEGHLHPDISYNAEDEWFYVRVKEYGLLNSSDLEDIIKGYTTALGVLNHLDTLDLTKLEVSSEDEE